VQIQPQNTHKDIWRACFLPCKQGNKTSSLTLKSLNVAIVSAVNRSCKEITKDCCPKELHWGHARSNKKVAIKLMMLSEKVVLCKQSTGIVYAWMNMRFEFKLWNQRSMLPCMLVLSWEEKRQTMTSFVRLFVILTQGKQWHHLHLCLLCQNCNALNTFWMCFWMNDIWTFCNGEVNAIWDKGLSSCLWAKLQHVSVNKAATCKIAMKTLLTLRTTWQSRTNQVCFGVDLSAVVQTLPETITVQLSTMSSSVPILPKEKACAVFSELHEQIPWVSPKWVLFGTACVHRQESAKWPTLLTKGAFGLN